MSLIQSHSDSCIKCQEIKAWLHPWNLPMISLAIDAFRPHRGVYTSLPDPNIRHICINTLYLLLYVPPPPAPRPLSRAQFLLSLSNKNSRQLAPPEWPVYAKHPYCLFSAAFQVVLREGCEGAFDVGWLNGQQGLGMGGLMSGGLFRCGDQCCRRPVSDVESICSQVLSSSV